MKVYLKYLSPALAIFGSMVFVGCVESKTPYSQIKLNTSIVDSQTQSPLYEGVRVILKNIDKPCAGNDTLYTDKNGFVQILADYRGANDYTVRLVVEDMIINGAKNYEKDSIDIRFVNSDFKGGDGDKYLGLAERDVKVELTK